MKNVYDINNEFERMVAEYCGAPYAVSLDNASNALFLSLFYEGIKGREVVIPNRTYPSVPCEVIHAGGIVRWRRVEGETITGAYALENTRTIDAALLFTADMYNPKTFMCLSFTGPYKTFKLSKGGMILTDDYDAYLWFRRARYSGRRECSYHTDSFDMLGWNFYMMPEIAARGVLMMAQFYNSDGSKKHNDPVTMRYPDLSKYKIYESTNLPGRD
jgi:dTDP-4-amino-4,6-dideoxygalactose transaminase